jgi:hypothetical protein
MLARVLARRRVKPIHTIPETRKVAGRLIVFIIRLIQDGLLRPDERPSRIKVKRRFEAWSEWDRRRIFNRCNCTINAVLFRICSLRDITR